MYIYKTNYVALTSDKNIGALGYRLECHFFVLTTLSSVIYYCTDPRQPNYCKNDIVKVNKSMNLRF